MNSSNWGRFDPDVRAWGEMEIPVTCEQGVFLSCKRVRVGPCCDCAIMILTGQRPFIPNQSTCQ